LNKKFGFKNNSKTILFVSRLNKDFVVPALEGLLAMDEPVNVIMVCGGNNELYKKIKQNLPSRQNFKLLNWTNRLDEYMKIADVVVGKPGGLMISECLALGKQIIMTDPIPGQEERNAEFMAKYGYGKFALEPDQIGAAVGEILQMPKIDLPANRSNSCPQILEYFK
jgi:processive 1,2-diacylglycerol beta-glucosyltransferase